MSAHPLGSAPGCTGESTTTTTANAPHSTPSTATPGPGASHHVPTSSIRSPSDPFTISMRSNAAPAAKRHANSESTATLSLGLPSTTTSATTSLDSTTCLGVVVTSPHTGIVNLIFLVHRKQLVIALREPGRSAGHPLPRALDTSLAPQRVPMCEDTTDSVVPIDTHLPKFAPKAPPSTTAGTTRAPVQCLTTTDHHHVVIVQCHIRGAALNLLPLCVCSTAKNEVGLIHPTDVTTVVDCDVGHGSLAKVLPFACLACLPSPQVASWVNTNDNCI